jgi:uncharacterized membrane protein (UPF0136 family)
VARSDRRLLVGALCGISLTLAAALVLGQPHGSLAAWSHDLARLYWPQLRHLAARKNLAAATQAVGALVTFYWLGRAYIRAKYDITVTAWILWRVFRRKPRGKDITVTPGPAFMLRTELSATAYAEIVIDPKSRLRDQIKQLAAFANSRSKEAAERDKRITDLGRELRKVRAETSELERKTLAHIETRINELSDRLDRIQVWDLRWVKTAAKNSYGRARNKRALRTSAGL